MFIMAHDIAGRKTGDPIVVMENGIMVEIRAAIRVLGRSLHLLKIR